MATLLFTPRTTIDANVFQDRLDNSTFHGEWNIRTGAYEFEIEECEADELEETISQELAYDINGRF
jgi:hypothetical protein